MKGLGIPLALFLLITINQSVFAQTQIPRIEVFGGFSYLPSGPEDFPRDTSYGFQTSVTGNLTRWFGVVGDFGGQYSSGDAGPLFPGGTTNTSMYEYMVGPRFTKRTAPVNVFGHVLVGGASGRTDIAGRFSDTEIALGFGGGVDINLGPRIAIRAIQLDYLGSFAEMLEDNARFGAGIVLKLWGP